MSWQRQARVHNRTAHARTGAVYFGIPLDAGQLRMGDLLCAQGASPEIEAVQWNPMGPRWPDGSVRYARCCTIVTLGPGEDRVIRVEPDTREHVPEPFAVSEAVAAGLAGYAVDLCVWPHRLRLTAGEVIEGGSPGDVYRRHRVFARFPDVEQEPGSGSLHPVWGEMVLDVYPRLGHARLWMSAGYSLAQPGCGRRGGAFPRSRLDLRTNVDLMVPNNTVWRYPDTTFAWTGPGDTGCTLWQVRAAWDKEHAQQFITFGRQFGQWAGVVKLDATALMAPAEAECEITGVCLDWDERYPPYQAVPDAPPYIRDLKDGIARTESLRKLITPTPNQRAPYWSPKVGSWPWTGAAGDLRLMAYGPNRGIHVLRPGWPNLFPELQASNRQHSQWSGWWYDEDGWLWDPEDYPGTWLWDGTIHGTATDYMGVGPALDQAGPKSDQGGTEFAGPDRQHWSHLWTALDALCTGDYHAVQCMERVARMLVAALYTDRAHGGGVPGPDSPRGIGRPMVNACLAWAVTGYAPLRESIRQRIALYERTMSGTLAEIEAGRAVFLGDVPGMGVNSRVGNLPLVHHSMPWEEAIAATGLWAVACTFPGEPWAERARDIAYAASATITLYWTADWRGTDQYMLADNSTFAPALPTREAHNGAQVVGLRSGATGVLWCCRPEGQQSGVYVHSVAGQFETGETVAIRAAGHPEIQFTAKIRVNSVRTYTAIRNNSDADRRPLTPEQAHDSYIGTPETTSHSFVGWQPLSLLPDWGTGYGIWVFPAYLIARDGALAGVYGSMSGPILGKANQWIRWHAEHSRTDRGDWGEIEDHTFVVRHAWEAPQPPEETPPPLLTMTSAAGVVTLQWEADPRITRYEIVRTRLTSEVLGTLYGPLTGPQTFTTTHQGDGQTYRYRISARTGDGTILTSNEVAHVEHGVPAPLPIEPGNPVTLLVTTSIGDVRVTGTIKEVIR